MTGSPSLHKFLQEVLKKAAQTECSERWQRYVDEVVMASLAMHEAHANAVAGLRAVFLQAAEEKQVAP